MSTNATSIWTKLTIDESTWPEIGQSVIISTPHQPTIVARNDKFKNGCWFGYQYVPYSSGVGLYWRNLIPDVDIIDVCNVI